jgi:hypothetical protein
MKKRKLLLIGVLIWNFNSLLGQSFCSTPSISSNLNLNSSFQMRTANNDSYCLRIYFHVIRRSNGTGGQSVENVEEAFNILNQDFNPHNISFNWDETINYINNDSYYSTPSTAIFNVNNHDDGIDIYLYDDSSSSGGRANGVGESSEFWVSGTYWNPPNNPLTTSHVISHEMGHVLYLWHTHHGTFDEGGNDNPCAELVNGSNSDTCGDYVSDTPADPHLQFDVNSSTCEWNSFGTDANGDSYDPDEQNVMAYTDINCMEYFSEGQGVRMRNAIATLPYLQQAIADNCSIQELSSIDQLCYSESKTLTISDIQDNITTWQVSSNVTILSSNNGSITVRAKYSNSTGNGWVKATLSNGIVLQEDFKVGVPDVSVITLESFNSAPLVTGIFTNVTARYDWLIDVGQLGYTWEWIVPTSQVIYHSPTYSYIHVSPLGNPTSIYIKTRACNECGPSEWKGKWFIVETPPTGCTNCPTRPGIIHY